MKKLLAFIGLLSTSMSAMAYSSPAASPESGLFRMMLGLVLVLAVFAGLAWAVKRMMPKISGNASTIQVKGSVSVGSRERVVVLQVADRFIVVGVAPGHVTALANIDANQFDAENHLPNEENVLQESQMAKHPFKEWLKKAASNF